MAITMTPQDRLIKAVKATERSVERARGQLRQFNEPEWPGTVEGILAQASELVHIHGTNPDANVADDYTNLAGALSQIEWPSDNDDQDRDDRLAMLRGYVGSLRIDFDTILKAASAMNIHPGRIDLPTPDPALIPKAGREAVLRGILQRLAVIETQINDDIRPESSGNRPAQQIVLVMNYLRVMQVNIGSVKLAINTGPLIDLNILERSGAAMVRATQQLIATVKASASAASDTLKSAAAKMRKPVGALIRGVGTLVKRVMRIADAPPPIPDDYLKQAHAMILRGEAPPVQWVPLIRELDFEDQELSDLTPLAHLTALETLGVENTRVSDIAPLAQLSALKLFSVSGTQVSDIAPLARLSALQHLFLRNTQVNDIAPLAQFSALKSLSLSFTQLNDIAPLAQLSALEWLSLSGPKLSDIAPLAQLSALEWLSLSGSQVSDIAPLASLTALKTLDLWNTQVSDIAPLASLAALQTLLLRNTQLSNITPLASLTALQSLDLQYTQVSDIAPLSELARLTITTESEERADTLRATLRSGSAVIVEMRRLSQDDDDAQPLIDSEIG
jgi:Leucine Rich repeats (2 copies)